MDINIIALQKAVRELTRANKTDVQLMCRAGDHLDLAVALYKLNLEFETPADSLMVEILWRYQIADYEGTMEPICSCLAVNGTYLNGTDEEDPLETVWDEEYEKIQRGFIAETGETLCPEDVELDIIEMPNFLMQAPNLSRFTKPYDSRLPLFDPENQAKILTALREVYSTELQKLPKTLKQRQSNLGF